MIKIKDICFSYSPDDDNPLLALDHIKLTIREGEFVALMGHNSSGKTTLVRCLNGLLIPQHGEIFVDELTTKNPADLLPIRKKVGMVFQNPDNQIVSTSVEREVAFGLENLGVAPETIHRVVHAILQQFDLEKYRQHPPHLLSGGEKQRLALAAVLAMNPKYLVLDEPSSMLDLKGRRDLLDLLLEIKRDNAKKKTTDQTSIILITQYPEEALLADRLLIMEGGTIVYDDSPTVVFQNVDHLKQIGLEAPVEFEILPVLVEMGYGSEVLSG
ncbi:MAG TPA: ATP-binding cassette domain-containing protein [bacterium]|nr:ATP-binding cassette domain-containing protein [bacterium]